MVGRPQVRRDATASGSVRWRRGPEWVGRCRVRALMRWQVRQYRSREHRPQPYRPSRRVLLGGFLGPSRQAGLYDTSFFRGAVCLTLVGKVKIAASALQLPMADIYLSLWVAILCVSNSQFSR